MGLEEDLAGALAAEASGGQAPPDEPPVAETDVAPDDTTGQPTADSAAEAETAIEPAPEAPEAPASLRERLSREFGLDASKYASDDEALKGLANAARLVGARQEDAELGRQLKPYLAQFEQFLQAQQAQQAQPAAPQFSLLDPPEWNEDWKQYLTADGKIAADAPVTVRPKIEQYVDWLKTFQREMYRNPRALLEAAAEARVAPLKQELQQLREGLAQQSDYDQANRFLVNNASWMFQDGNVESRQLSPAGTVFRDTYNAALEMIQRDPTELAKQYALSVAKQPRGTGAKPPAATKPPATAARTRATPKPASEDSLYLSGSELERAIIQAARAEGYLT